MIRGITLLWAVAVVAAAHPVFAQGQPFERFPGSFEVERTTMPAPGAEITYSRVAGGLGLHSVWRHGSGESFYEAQALWGYDPDSSAVTVLEVNSNGLVAMHSGRVDVDGVLRLERYDDDGVTVLERRVFWWSDERTLEMTADFFSDSEDPVHHEVTLVRRER